MRRYAFVIFLLGLGAFAQEITRGPGNPAGTSSSEAAPDAATSQAAGSPDAATPYTAPGYIITPWGSLILPDAPPLAGDTSTLSGPGPNVSEGPVVGSGPEVSTGPDVGSGPEVSTGPEVGSGPELSTGPVVGTGP